MFKHYEMVALLAKIVEERDAYTSGHSKRVARYATMIAESMELDDHEQSLIYQSGLLHDIGKISTPESILLKPGNLNAEEFTVMKEHSRVGWRMIKDVFCLKPLGLAVLHHHERYDGLGYPNGLRGEEIPLHARILAVADAFDAMTSHRAYRKVLTVQDATEELIKNSGTQFDPSVVQAALKPLSTVAPPQVKKTVLFDNFVDRNRLAYAFKDSLTDAYNGRLLDAYLLAEERHYRCCYHFSIKGMHSYNHLFGWKEGDLALISVARRLKTFFPNAYVFRLHGDEFIVLNEQHNEIDIEKIKIELIKNFDELQITVCHYDLQKEHFLSWEDISKRGSESNI